MRLYKLPQRSETFVVEIGDPEVDVWNEHDHVDANVGGVSSEDALSLATRIADGLTRAGLSTRVVLRRTEWYAVKVGR